MKQELELINKIIPPANRTERDGFDNSSILRKLSIEQKKWVTDELIRRLKNDTKEIDTLIVETIANIGLDKGVQTLYSLFDRNLSKVECLIISTTIFEANKDLDMINIGISAFKLITDKYQLVSSFHYLAKFKTSKRARQLLENYSKNNDVLIAYNAKRYC